MNSYDFTGRTAIITGGARGLGRAAADLLAASGARVAIWDLLDPVPADEFYAPWPDNCISLKVDLTDPEAVEAAYQTTLAAFGRVDILLNGAGVSGPTKPMEEFSLQEWRRVVQINLDSVFLASKAVIPQMKAQGYGRIISISSVAAKQGNPSMAGYSAAKGAVLALTKALALELAGTGVLVNSITPALFNTELLKEMSDDAVALSLSKIPLGRVGHLREFAALFAFAASEDCGFTTGQAFDLSGGRASY